ncbi:MAG: glucose 1-dehydrogenase [Rhodococcus sp. (in: high G+C Gram-positive bacteria)]|uniref:SDR family NAD(P)-dependent oxidoreductase n=1 Tax=Rhodococcus sp. TaxID=1831 RepID=UPI0011FF04D9|nr:glucose 1-dehydrogenase [Rhodococcus sp. (in: high G+C Gram-positive bacteria)]RZL23116.1 MAG: glucose 1-dehydrogenase [Rhodococcus sp. (in: high G+C Gram-positive bacteria)]
MSDVLEGKLALITGATRGLGRAIAQALAEAGATVVVSSRKADACEATAREITEVTGARTLALPLHVGQWDAIGPALARVEAELGLLDVVVNNAGIAPISPSLIEQSEALYDKTMDVNLKGPFRLMSVAGEQMVRGGGGSIINISSIGSQRPSAAEATYSAAKAGLNVLTQAFAQEYAPTVRVNCLMPGAFATDMAETWDEDFVSAVIDGLPAGRLGVPTELTGMVVHLASDASSYTTGAVIPIDGGRLAVY